MEKELTLDQVWSSILASMADSFDTIIQSEKASVTAEAFLSGQAIFVVTNDRIEVRWSPGSELAQPISDPREAVSAEPVEPVKDDYQPGGYL